VKGKLGIIGGGVVGQATARSYIEHVDQVRVYDIDPTRSTCQHPLDILEWAELIFICLPTPQNPNSLRCDTSAIDQFFASLGNIHRCNNFVIRSTVPIGYTRRCSDLFALPNLVHSPEFLTARCATVDAQIPSRNIIGLPVGVYASKLEGLYRARWPHVPVHTMTSNESEAVKLFQNSFFAVKVAFWNEAREFADKMKLDWERVMNAVLADGRIHPSHTTVPGPDGKFGFGGTCLPKDLANLNYCISKSGCDDYITDAALSRNAKDRHR